MTGLLAVACGLAAVVLAIPAGASGAAKIQPGAQLRLAGSICTANFIYDGIGARAGHTYVGVASHCAADDAPVGTMISTNDGVEIGPLVLSNWPLKSIADDYALIEVLPERLADVDPSLAGHPEWPTGMASPDDVSPGDVAAIGGWGAGVSSHQTTRENRFGVITDYDDVYYDLVGPIVFGDSGGGLIHHATGGALGIVSAYCDPTNASPDHPFGSPCAVYGPTIAEVIRRAATKGFPTRMRLAGEPPLPPPPASPAPSAPPAPQPAGEPRSAPSKKTATARRRACLRKARRVKSKPRRRAATRRCARIGR